MLTATIANVEPDDQVAVNALALLDSLASRGFRLDRRKKDVVVRSRSVPMPELFVVDLATNTLTAPLPGRLSPKKARRSAVVSDHALLVWIHRNVTAARSLPADDRVTAIVAIAEAARRTLEGADGVRAASLDRMQGQALRGGLPGLGKRR